MRRTFRPAVAAAALIGVVSTGVGAAPARAAAPAKVYTQLNGDGSGTYYLHFEAAAGTRNTPVFTRSGTTLIVDDRVPLKAGAGCVAVKGDSTKVRCTRPLWYDIIAALGDGNDTLTNKIRVRFWGSGGAGTDTLYGGPGIDLFHGDGGNDTLYGGAGDDQLLGGAGVDHVWGGTGNDGLVGNENTDYLHGQSGADYLVGTAGNDFLYGEDGPDNLEGGSGNDKLYGGDGADLLRSRPYPGMADSDYYSGGLGTDTVTFADQAGPVTADADGVKGDDGVSGERDTVDVDVNVLVGGSGDDRLSGVYGRQVQLFGGRGDDTLRITGTNTGASRPNLLDGGANRTAAGDLCSTVAPKADTRLDCER